MLDILNSLSWPALFTILGSLATGLIALFGYWRSANKEFTQAQKVEYEKTQSRISSATDRISDIEGDLKVTNASLRNLQKQLSDHEQRDIDDFKIVDVKIDRLMDIVVKILQDDKL